MNKHDLFLFSIIGLVIIIGVFAAVKTPTGYYLASDGSSGYSQLTVSTSGHGYVSSSPSGIECGYACSESYDTGTVITLKAKPLGDSVFQSWSGACSGSDATCTVNLDGSQSVGATFSDVKTASVQEGVTAEQQEDQTQEIAPQQEPLKKQEYYQEKQPSVQSSTYIQKPVTSYKQKTATTITSASTVVLKVKKTGQGVVTSQDYKIYCGEYCNGQYQSQATVKLQVYPNAGYVFDKWSGACIGKDACVVVMNKEQEVQAHFIDEKKQTIQPYPAQQPVVPPKKHAVTSRYTIQPHSYDDGQYPAACEDYPTMPGCPEEGTNIAPPQPAIPEVIMTGFEPRKAYPRTPVFIEGKNLGYVSKVYFNGELVEGFSTTRDGTELQTLVPQGAETGPIQLLLTSGGAEYSDKDFVVLTGVCKNPDMTRAFKQLNKLPHGQGDEDECNVKKYLQSYSNYKQLRNAIQKIVGFSKLSLPKIISFNPSPALPGQEVSIIGAMFDIYADDVLFDGKSLSFKLIDEREVKITIPENTVFGDHELTIVSDIHGSGSAKIKIIPLPRIDRFSPSKVAVNEEVTIQGENFYEPSEISFYDQTTKKEILKKDFRKDSLQQIKVNAPPDPGSYTITMKGKNSYVKTETLLTVVPKSLPPEITNIEPEEGKLGNNAIIYGKNLNGLSKVTLNGYQITYQTDNSDTAKKIYVSWGIDHGLIEITTPGGKAQAQLLSNKDAVTKLITGKEETCFGGVGKGCYGSEDNKEEWVWGSQKIVAPVGCSQEVNGQRNCWVVPGSIKHDNCCARYPSGKMCGGPGKDGQPAGESNHNGRCVSEWDAAFWDVFWWRAFVATFNTRGSTDLTPKESSRYTLKDDNGNVIPSETAETLKLCAPQGHELREQSDEGFCCSGRAQNKRCTGGRGIQTLPEAESIERTESGVDLSTVPIPLAPGETPKEKRIVSVRHDDLQMGKVVSTPKGIECGMNNKLCTAKFLDNTKLSIEAIPAEGHEISWWEGCVESEEAATRKMKYGDKYCTVQVNGNKNIWVKFRKSSTTFIAKVTGAGKIKSNPAGLDCPPTCQADFKINKFITITAVPDPGSAFIQYSTEADCESTKPECNIMSTGGTENIEAKFKEIPITKLTIVHNKKEMGKVISDPVRIDCGSGSDFCEGFFPQGQTVTLTAIPTQGHIFDFWPGCMEKGIICQPKKDGKKIIITITMDQSKTLTAKFEKDLSKFYASVTGPGKIISSPQGLDCPPKCEFDFKIGERVTITTTPNQGAKLEKWAKDSSCLSSPCEMIATAGGYENISAVFIQSTSIPPPLQPTSTLIIDHTYSGSIKSSDGEITNKGFDVSTKYCRYDMKTVLTTCILPSNKEFTINAVPDGFAEHTGWSGDCQNVAIGQPCKLFMNGNKRVGAWFYTKPQPKPNPQLPPTLTLIIDHTYSGSIKSSDEQITNRAFDVPTKYCKYDMNTFLTTCTLPSNKEFTINAMPDSFAEHTGWSGDCQNVAIGQPCKLFMNGNKRVGAWFYTKPTAVPQPITPPVQTPELKIKQYQLLVTKKGTGAGKVTSEPTGIDCGSDCSENYKQDNVITLTVKPDAYTVFAGWEGVCSGNKPTCTVTMDVQKTVIAKFNKRVLRGGRWGTGGGVRG